MFRSKPCIGATLVEVLIASALALMLTVLASQALVSAASHHQRIKAETALEATLLTTLDHIHSRLSESRLSKIEISPTGVVFPSPRTVTGELNVDPATGRLEWSSVGCFSFDATTERIEEFAAPLPSLAIPIYPMDLTPVHDLPYVATNGVPLKVAATGVVEFTLQYLQEDGPDPDQKPDIATRKSSTLLGLEIGLRAPKGSSGELLAEILVHCRN